jgi:dihydropteroate synthase
VVEWVHRAYPEVLISVDTYKPLVVQATLAAGAAIINDVSGLAYPEVAELCAKHDSALVVMHTRAQPKVRRQDPELYPDVTTDVLAFLRDRIDAAADRGLSREAIIVDPGPDFTKTPYQTVAVLRRINEVHALGRPVLLALSRKDFIGAILEKPPRGRDVGTIAAVAYLTGVPGTILRVHDVTATRQAIRVIDVLVGRRELDPYYVLPDNLRREPTV